MQGPLHPRRHGHDYQLDCVYRGRKTSKFIRRGVSSRVRTELANHKKFRRLTERWIGLALQIAEISEKLIARSQSGA